jgi:hypothetical protein
MAEKSVRAHTPALEHDRQIIATELPEDRFRSSVEFLNGGEIQGVCLLILLYRSIEISLVK